ncbi:MAG TPA: DUF4129 domain-containing protein [Thermoanaerobaculia bacterium]|jgi:hypothetical protein|nr:DUF4129 domain-containing protein [Thermoanaerobaculia bacterium]
MSKRLLLILLMAMPVRAAVLTLDQYVDSLARLRALVASGQREVAASEAKALAGSEVESANGRFHANDALLGEVAAPKAKALRLLSHLDTELAQLRRAAPAATSAPNHKLLQQVEKEEEIEELQKGGTVGGTAPPQGSWYQRLARMLFDFGAWLRDKLERFGEWLEKFWPKSDGKEGPNRTVGMRWIVTGIVALIVIIIAILAWEVIRRSRAAQPEAVEESAPLGSKADEDPLSRGATEWERYAAQLAAAGRIREAIRAWYNAVLVTAYGAHILHYRKGRTNWEYVAALGPRIEWRPEFVQLTRRFEQEWYGSDHSNHEALDECSGRAQRILDAIRRAARGAA